MFFQFINLKAIKSFFKLGIVFFVLISTSLGYALGLSSDQKFSITHFFIFSLGVFFISAGSLALNQVQEREADRLMPRTQSRVLSSGSLPTWLALVICVVFLAVGIWVLWHLKVLSGIIGIVIVVFYNIFYTLSWKKKLAFAAVPGAIPGALPVVLGFSAVSDQIFSSPSIYLFLLMFLWQMPHFWALAMRFSKDYALGGFPVLPLVLGNERTLFHMGLYVIVYTALALASPLFLDAKYFYVIIVIPFVGKILYEFYRYYQVKGEKRWLSFFLWTNFSIIAFLLAAVIDKWFLVLSGIVEL